MKILALDTATRHATVALLDENAPSIVSREREVTTHSEGLLTMVDELLAEAGLAVRALDAIVVGLGPGSFTGLRIGLATAKGLCLAARLPLVGLSSLQPLAAAVAELRLPEGGDHEERLTCVVLDARRGEVFAQRYRGERALEPERLCRPEALAAELAESSDPLLLAGDGALLYRELLAREPASLAPEGCHLIHARHLALAARARVAAGHFDELATLVPRYLRASDARLPERPLWRPDAT